MAAIDRYPVLLNMLYARRALQEQAGKLSVEARRPGVVLSLRLLVENRLLTDEHFPSELSGRNNQKPLQRGDELDELRLG